jgi:uncharacterized protein (DUF4415 family)
MRDIEALNRAHPSAPIPHLTDREIEAAVAADPDAPPLLSDEQWSDAVMVYPGNKVSVTLRIDGHIIDFFRREGKGWQTRMNDALADYVSHRTDADARTTTLGALERTMRLASAQIRALKAQR